MSVVSMKSLLEAGVHFGHQTRRWNPKMKRYIFTERNGIYIIDLQKTLTLIEKAYDFIREEVAHGGDVLFVGTKKQAQESIEEHAKRCGMPYVNTRWLGGTLTNWSTIRRRIERMIELERMRSEGLFEEVSKKEATRLRHELTKLHRTLDGLRNMHKLPAVVYIIDPRKEHIAVREANRMGIPIVAIVDTNCDPDEVQYVIPGNDDAIRAGNLISSIIANAVLEGLEARDAMRAAGESEGAGTAAEEKPAAVSAREARELEEAFSAPESSDEEGVETGGGEVRDVEERYSGEEGLEEQD
jgi:small subunit ribosomal protein S2